MIGIDTNVLVRYFVQDDDRQSTVAAGFIDSLTTECPGYVTTGALLELCWVLGACYKLERQGVSRVLLRLLQTPRIRLEQAQDVAEAVERFEAGGADLPDYLIERRCFTDGCQQTITFDVRAARFAGMTLCTADAITTLTTPPPPAASPRPAPRR